MAQEIKAGQKYELAPGEQMWKDDLSGVHLRAPGRVKISRPSDEDYRSQMEWFTSKRLKDPNKVLFKDDKGETWFEVTKGMNISRIKIAVSKGILVPKGKAKKIEEPIKDPKNLFRTDKRSGERIYDGPNKQLYRLLQKNKEADLLNTINKIKDPHHLEILLDMEQKGWNPAASARGHIVEALQNQIKDKAIGLTKITEEESETTTLEEELAKAKENIDN